MRFLKPLAAAGVLATVTATPAFAVDAEQLRRDLVTAVAEGTSGTLTIRETTQRGSRLVLRGVVGSWKSTNRDGEPVHVVVSSDAVRLDRPSRDGDFLKARSARFSNLTARFGEAVITLPRLDIRDFALPLGDAALSQLSWSNDWRYGAIETGDVRIQLGDAWSGTVGQVLLVNEGFVGPLPTRSYVQIEDVDLPIPADQDNTIPHPLRRLGYETIAMDLIVRSRLDPESETLILEEMVFDVEDVGRLSLSLQLGQYDVDRLQKAAARVSTTGTGDPSEFLGAMLAITLDSCAFSFEDQSIVGRLLDREAAKRGIARDKFTDQLAGMLPFLLAQIGHPEFERQAAEAVTSFLKDPGRIALYANPEHPIGALQIAMAAQSAPASLVDLLSLVIEAAPAR